MLFLVTDTAASCPGVLGSGPVTYYLGLVPSTRWICTETLIMVQIPPLFFFRVFLNWPFSDKTAQPGCDGLATSALREGSESNNTGDLPPVPCGGGQAGQTRPPSPPIPAPRPLRGPSGRHAALTGCLSLQSQFFQSRAPNWRSAGPMPFLLLSVRKPEKPGLISADPGEGRARISQSQQK